MMVWQSLADKRERGAEMTQRRIGAIDAEVVVRGDASGLAQQVRAGSHGLTADEPVADGGTDTGPTPYDLLLAALGS